MSSINIYKFKTFEIIKFSFYNLKNKRTNFNADRDEIRRKLAIVSSSSSSSSFNEHSNHANNNTNANNETIIPEYMRKNANTSGAPMSKSYLGKLFNY